VQHPDLVLLLITGLVIGSIYALISLGFNVIYRTTGVINFAQGEFVMIGGVVAAWSYALLDGRLAHGLLLVAAVAAGMLAAALTGVLLDLLAIRPLRNAGPVMYVIATIGASIVIRAAVSLVWGTEPFHLPLPEQTVALGSSSFALHQLLILPVAAVCMLLLTLFFRRTRVGQAMQACAENAEAARLCGVRTARMSTLAFGVSALLGGIGGILVTPALSMSYDGGTMLGLKGFAAAILGGIGNPVGGVLGGLLIGVLEQVSCWYSSLYKDTLALAIVVVILLVRPKGLLRR